MGKARKSIAALTELASKTALLKKDGKTEEVGIDQLSVGDIIVVRPNSKISADGVVVAGESSVNQALETADIALMGDKLEALPLAIGLSRKARSIIKQNLWMSLGVVAALVPLTITGVASIGPAIMAHEGSTLVVVLNALRLLAYRNNTGAPDV